MQSDGRFFEMLETDLSCQKKDIRAGIDDRPIHNHDGYEALFLMDGTATIKTEADKTQIHGGDLVVIHSGAYHHGEPENRGIYDRVVISLKESYARNIIESAPNLSDAFSLPGYEYVGIYHLSPKDCDEFLTCSDLLSQTLQEEEFGADVLAQSYLKRLLVLINRLPKDGSSEAILGCSSQKAEIVKSILAFIDIHLADDLSLSMLEKLFMYSGPYISKCFRELTGMSIQNYIIKKRIILARKYMEQGLPLSRVCELTGFGNYSNFSRTFLQYTGESPKTYQNNHIKY